MDDFLSLLPEEITIRILSRIDGEDLSKLSALFPRIKKLTEESGLWLTVIQHRFDINLSNEKAYALLIKLLDAEIAQKIMVTLVNKKQETKSLGKILVTAADTLGQLVTKIKNKFGLLGNIDFQQLCDASAQLAEDKYCIYRITYEGYYDAQYAQLYFDTVILPRNFSDSLSDEQHILRLNGWLSNKIIKIMPKPLLDNLEIVIYEYSFSERELKIIDTALEAFQ